jgi:hypothetical protein
MDEGIVGTRLRSLQPAIRRVEATSHHPGEHQDAGAEPEQGGRLRHRVELPQD